MSADHIAPATAPQWPFGYLGEFMKASVRLAVLRSVCIPGYQVPYVSEEVPIARGYGSGGLQVTLSLIGPEDRYKIIDEGDDETVNAVNLRRMVGLVTGATATYDPERADLIQTRHKVPEAPLREDQIVILQVAFPDALRFFERSEAVARQMHAEKDYSKLWLRLYESVVSHGEIMIGGRYPVMVEGRYVLDPTHVPRWDLPMLDHSPALFIFCAGREKRIYSIPPDTRVEPLGFEDHPFRVEDQTGRSCGLCGATDSFLAPCLAQGGGMGWLCSDTAHCRKRRGEHLEDMTWQPL
jgi:alpha-D-ribose 1-methylphosphonate 5-phosphate C-P lyase